MQPPEAKKYCKVWVSVHFEEAAWGHQVPERTLRPGRARCGKWPGMLQAVTGTGTLPSVTREAQPTPGNPLCHGGETSRRKRKKKKKVASSH